MSEITRAAIGMPFSMAMESELSRRQFHSIAQAVLAERDQLRAEVAGLRTGYEAYEQVNAELKAEVEKLRKEDLRAGLMALAAYIGPICTNAVLAAMGQGEQS